MATEKILNTRIQLKYDTLANWNASTFKLKPGELAIVKVGEMKDGSTHDNAQYPVLFKVGTGEHTFSQLPFASALAADVYAWAKAADVKLEGKTIKFVDAAGTAIKSVELNYITDAEAATKINKALTAYSTTEQMNAAIKVETDRAEAAEKALGERIDAFNLPEGGFASKSEFDTLKGKVEDEDGALARANDAYELAEGKTTMAEVEGKGYATKTYTDEELAKKADQETTYTKDEVDGLFESFEIDKINPVIDSKADLSEISRIDAEVADVKETAEAAKAAIDTFMGTIESDTEVVDTLEEIISLINSEDAELSTTLLGEINTLKTADITLQGNIDKKADQTVVDGIEDRVEALEAKPFDTYATKTEVENVDKKFEGYTNTEALTALLAEKQDVIPAETYDEFGAAAAVKEELNETISDVECNVSLVNEELQALINDVAIRVETYGDIVTHDAEEFATAAQGAKADSALQEITTTANGGLKVTNKNQIDIDTDVVFVFDCGTASVNI